VISKRIRRLSLPAFALVVAILATATLLLFTTRRSLDREKERMSHGLERQATALGRHQESQWMIVSGAGRPAGLNSVPTVWATGTSSPCLSVFKPAPLDPALFPLRPVADPRFDANELWWAHERLHRACLADYHARRVAFAEDHERFQDTCLEPAADAATVWREHRARIDDWLPRALEIQARRLPMITRWYWARQSKLSALPAQ